MSNSRLTKKHILHYFKEGESKNEWVGLEAEKIGLRFPDGSAVSYTGKNGFLAVLGKMYEELGWKITQQDGGNIHQMKLKELLM